MNRFLQLYRWLYELLGPQEWWPADGPFEVMVGAVLTQQTKWQNVEKAISNLKERNLLSPEEIVAVDENELAECIRPTGFYRQKAARLKDFARFLCEVGFDALEKENTLSLRNMLLDVKGVGPETADSILLYGLERPVFVIDAYTKRMLSCMNIKGTYNELQ
ncbi:MAG: endonuclease [Methermicoccaceae archaeon]